MIHAVEGAKTATVPATAATRDPVPATNGAATMTAALVVQVLVLVLVLVVLVVLVVVLVVAGIPRTHSTAMATPRRSAAETSTRPLTTARHP
jgi:hypothetical protein